MSNSSSKWQVGRFGKCVFVVFIAFGAGAEDGLAFFAGIGQKHSKSLVSTQAGRLRIEYLYEADGYNSGLP